VVPAAEVGSPLLGLRGITSRRGRGTVDPARMLQTDATLQRFAELAGGTVGETPGAGACGGIGLAVLALGGQLTSGPDLALAAVPDPPPFDLVVSGCTVFDFATRGGGVVAAAARVAAAALGPCIVVAGEVVIGAREMRTMGIEAAYPVRESSLDDPVGAVTEAEIAATARRVARSWTW
jgi:glycerate kinase